MPTRTRGVPEGYLYDPEDEALVHSACWQIGSGGYLFHQRRRDGKMKRTLFHRAVMQAPDDMQVDHRDGNVRDNRKANLRLVTPAENAQNLTRLRADNRSGYRGVSWDKARRGWAAQIFVRKKNRRLGVFFSKEKAARIVAASRIGNMPGYIDHEALRPPSLLEGEAHQESLFELG